MRYLELTLENFRVFTGIQTLTFPSGDGVLIVYGRNGKGKTSLLNAIRWAWTGVARRRGNREVDPERLVNKEAISAAGSSPVTCRVRLEFETDGTRWDLTRSLRLDSSGLTPDVTLLRDGVSLNSSDTAKTLAELMPREIEQFFLFDGELLDQYEKLVDDEGPAGSPLRDSIERILGVPVVVNAARDMRALADDAGKAIAEAAKRESRTRELGLALEQAQLLRTRHRENRDAESDRITKLQAKLREVEEQLAEQSSRMDLLGRRNQTREQLTQLEGQLEVAREAFKVGLATSWRAVLVDPLKDAVAELETTLERDRERLSQATVAAVLSNIYKQNGERSCPACASDLDAEHTAHLAELLTPIDGVPLAELTERVQDTAARVKTLRRVVDEQARADLRSLEDNYRRLQLEIDDVKQELAQLEDALRDGPTDELVDLAKRQRDLGIQLQKAHEVWEKESTSFEEVTVTLNRLRQQIDAMGGGTADPAVVERERLTSSLAALFEQGVVAYREKLKEDVQETASKLFRNMRSEADFFKLVINDHYGLRILDTKGNPVEDRSAGYEHLVALSLVGALQECSPITGPIVMDSPFGRLDQEHVEAVVGQLHVLADQVLLLVHEGEIDRPTARRQLHGRLLAEYELQRVSAYNTIIREVRVQ